MSKEINISLVFVFYSFRQLKYFVKKYSFVLRNGPNYFTITRHRNLTNDTHFENRFYYSSHLISSKFVKRISHWINWSEIHTRVLIFSIQVVIKSVTTLRHQKILFTCVITSHSTLHRRKYFLGACSAIHLY